MAATEPPPAPRRTYGRARPAVVDEADDGPSLLVSRSAAAPSLPPQGSPAKELLSGFMNRNASWRGGLGGLLSDPAATSSDKEGEGEDEEDVRKMMAQLSRAARTGEAVPLTLTVPEEARDSGMTLAPPAVASTRLLHEFSSTTLSEAPSTLTTSTSRPSSPPPQPLAAATSALAPPSPDAEAETVPIRKPGASRPSGYARRVAESSDEDDTASRRNARAESSKRSPSPGSRPIADLDLSPGIRFTPTPTSSPDAVGKGKARGLASYLERTAAESDAEDEAAPAKTRLELSGDEGSDTKGDAKVKARKHKPLNKKDKLEMQKDMARAGRQRSYAPARAKGVQLPMSSYLPDASAVISALDEKIIHTTPPLLPTKPSEREIKLESSIVAFTSSEGPSKPHEEVVTANLASSPTPAGSRPPPRTSRSGSADQEIPEIGDLLAKPPPTKGKMDLAAIKAAALAKSAAQKAQPPRMSGSDSEDDFSVLPKGAFAPVRPNKPVIKAKRDPLALRVMPPKQEHGASSPHRKLQIVGRPSKPKDFTETHVDFAGKAFDHAGLKGINNGTRKAGQKAGRDVVVPQSAIDQKMKLAHAAQVKAIAAKKQAEWGRVKALPERRAPDAGEYLASVSVIQEREAKEAEGRWDEDEDEDDDDFRPDGGDDNEGEDMEDADEDIEGGGEEDAIAWSGEEDMAEDEDAVSMADTEKDSVDADEDKENAPTVIDDDEDGPVLLPFRVTKVRRRAQRIAGSDSEDDETPRRHLGGRAPLAEMPLPQPSAAAPAPMLGFDLAGFGDDESGGFSQLFEATQINTGVTQQEDAFAGLRAAPQGMLLPSQALLPGVQISDTQKERDNALVGGDMDDEGMLQPEKKQQYLNSQGFFTQTKPPPMLPEPTQLGDATQAPTRGLTSAWSFGQLPIGEEEEELFLPPSMAKRATGAGDASSTQESPAFSRLKRRNSSTSQLETLSEIHEDMESTEDDEAGGSTSPTTAPAPPRDAFSRMMTAAKRKEEREKRRKERSAWIEGEAEESDEDNAWGDIGGGDDEDEGEGDEADQYDPELVDDAAVSEEEKKRQDELAEQKMREIEKADDEKREAQARDIIDGKHRSKRRGMDFYSDEDDEDGNGKPRRLSKKQRRKRDLGREDGLDKLEGEENVFRKAYEDDLESDEDDTIEDPLPISPKHSHDTLVHERVTTRSPEPRRSMKEKMEMLKAQARRNREVSDAEEEQRRLDEELGYANGHWGTLANGALGDDPMDDTLDVESEIESQFSISRSARPLANGGNAPLRSAESWQEYVQAESQTTRRTGALAGGGSVVVMNKSIPGLPNNGRPRGAGVPSRSNSTLSSGSGGVLRSKTSGFV